MWRFAGSLSSKIFLLLSFLSTIGSRWLMLLTSYAKNLLNATGLSSGRRMAKHQTWISCSKWGLPRSCYFWESSSLAPWISLERSSHVLLQLWLGPGPPGTCTVFLKYSEWYHETLSSWERHFSLFTGLHTVTKSVSLWRMLFAPKSCLASFHLILDQYAEKTMTNIHYCTDLFLLIILKMLTF